MWEGDGEIPGAAWRRRTVGKGQDQGEDAAHFEGKEGRDEDVTGET